jgi:two-component system nitrate/nitrite response regulator NarL
LIVDGDLLFVEAIRGALEDYGMLVVDISRTEETVELMERFLPDLILMDLRLPDRGGLDAGRMVLNRWPETRILAVTRLDDRAAGDEALRLGFFGYLAKDASVAQLVSSIRSVLDGRFVVPYELSPDRQHSSRSDDAKVIPSQLSPREDEVLLLLAQGSDGASISRTLGISGSTVRMHVKSILAKLHIHSRLDAAALTVQIRFGNVGIPEGDGSEPGRQLLSQIEVRPPASH